MTAILSPCKNLIRCIVSLAYLSRFVFYGIVSHLLSRGCAYSTVTTYQLKMSHMLKAPKSRSCVYKIGEFEDIVEFSLYEKAGAYLSGQ